MVHICMHDGASVHVQCVYITYNYIQYDGPECDCPGIYDCLQME